jgi:allantoate deiminase
VAAALAVSRLQQKHGRPKKALEVIAFSEEEGARFPFNFLGSKALVENIDWAEAGTLKDKNGVSMAQAMAAYGFNYKDNCAKRDDIKAFVEIHIEQGGVLDSENMDIGIVTGIVGYKKFKVELFGEANHAGTTPMSNRKDAGFTAALIISEVIKLAKEYGAPMVATVGQIEFHPALANVVPASAHFTLDMRHTDGELLNRFQLEAAKIIKKIGAENRVTSEFTAIFDDKPVYMDSDIMAIITKVSEKHGVKHMNIHSGAGHDSQILSRIAPVGMIFVPSKGGISHNPNEFTEPEQLELGVSILEDTLHALAY